MKNTAFKFLSSEYLNTTYPEVKIGIAKGIGKLKTQEALSFLISEYPKTSYPVVKSAIAEAIGICAN